MKSLKSMTIFLFIMFMTLLIMTSISYKISIRNKINTSLSLFGKQSQQPSPALSPDLYVLYLPSKVKIQAIPGKSLIDYGKIVQGPVIPVSCRKGECRKCEVMIDNKVVLGCKAKIPTVDKFPSSKVFQVTIPTEPGKKGVIRKSF